MGARLRLKAGKDISGFPADVQKIFRAMKQYGLIVADNGSDMFVTGTFDTRWDNDVLNPAFSALKAGDFEVVKLGWKPTPAPPPAPAGMANRFRLFSDITKEHHYTTDLNEYTVLGGWGWTQEGTDGYILPTPVSGVTVPLYRLRYSYLPLHLWTTDLNEYTVIPSWGWVQEGVAGYVVP